MIGLEKEFCTLFKKISVSNLKYVNVSARIISRFIIFVIVRREILVEYASWVEFVKIKIKLLDCSKIIFNLGPRLFET